MSPDRIQTLYADFAQALGRLQEALTQDIKQNDLLIDGVIQRFEFTFELAWKLAKMVVQYQGIEAAAPRMAIKEAFRLGFIQDGQGWINMLEDRNKTSHLYDQAEALRIYTNIKSHHTQLFDAFRGAIKRLLSAINE